MKLLVIPNNIEQLDTILNKDIDGVILSIEKLSVYFNFSIKLNELNSTINKVKSKDKEIFLSINKIMHNSDLELVSSFLNAINGKSIDGVFISDLGAFNIIRREYPNINIVMDQTHLITNYKTCNYWLNKEVKYVNLSNELMLSEINKISSNTNILLINQVFGYIPMFNSNRKLITNYFNYINKEKKDDTYYIHDEKKNTNYIVNEQDETVIYSANIMNGIRELDKLDIEYGILNGYHIDDNLFYEVINSFIKVNNNEINPEKAYKNTNINNMDTGFLYKESIYKVRDHE